MLKELIIGKKENSGRNSYIWNLIASGVNASEAIIVLMIATRTIGIEESGVISIAFTFGYLMLTIGKYGMRNYQATDIFNQFSFRTYRNSRLVTVIIMLICALSYIGFNVLQGNYNISKAVVILMVVGIYVVDAVEDVYIGLFQREKRLDIGMKFFSIRWILTIITWCLSLFIFRNSIIAVACGLAVNIVVFSFLLAVTKSEIKEYEKNCDGGKMISLLVNCLPLCLSSFLAYYISNASKYAIDIYLTDDIQAMYGFVAMPIFVISLLNAVIYQPVLVSMAETWNKGEYRLFIKRVYRQLVVVAAIALVCLGGAWVFGIPVLSFIYAADLSNYKSILMILLVAGTGLALTGFFGAIITLMRRQRLIMIIYGVFALAALLLAPYLVKNYGVFGAAYLNLFLNCTEALIFGVIIFILILKRKSIWR